MSDKGQENQTKTYFGNRVVEAWQKPDLVRGVFENVAQKYDIMNDVMSFGIHRLWREAMMDWLAPHPAWRLLDVAGGTGDIAFRFLRRASRAKAHVLDMTAEMIDVGRKRSEAADYGDRIAWLVGDAMALPFEREVFDCYTIAFGIRNVADIEKALCEAYKVLKRGGRIMVLEFSTLTSAPLKRLYDLYSDRFIPEFGRLIVGDGDSYQYLVESIRRFPNQARFCAMMEKAGFEAVEYRNLSGGIVALHSGWKI